MMGFAVSTVAVIMAAWFGYCAGRMRAPTPMNRILDHRCPNGSQYYIGCLSCGSKAVKVSVVPAGTCATPCHPADCDDSCPRYPEVQRLARAHVALDDRTYGRNG